MKRLLSFFLMLTACAVVSRIGSDEAPPNSPFSVAGVRLGMMRAELVSRLGEPYSEETGRLMNGVDCSPEDPHGELHPWLVNYLGPPDWSEGDGAFVIKSTYVRHHLTIQFGCTGWYFFLGL